jgi:hybrid cluster-associated redox disulfide protein
MAGRASEKKGKALITRGMTLGELVERFPQAAMVMARRGMHCIGCHMAAWETVEQGARAHGMPDRDIDKLLEEMNMAAGKKK